MPNKPILCLDMDGVCHGYQSGWQGIDVLPDPPVPGLETFLREALQHFEVHIHSARSSEEIGRIAMMEWFKLHCGGLVTEHLHFPTHKPPAMVTLDDRAIQFRGTWPDVQQLLAFQPWTRNTPPPHEQPPSAEGTGFAEPGSIDRRQEAWQQRFLLILDHLQVQIRQLSHEPEMQSALEGIWYQIETLRREERATP